MKIIRRELLKDTILAVTSWLIGRNALTATAENFGSSYYICVDVWGMVPEDEKLYLSTPVGLAKDDQGNIHVADLGNCRIVKLSTDGLVIGKFGELGSLPGQFDLPFGVAVDNNRSILVTDSANSSRVQKFTNNGDFICEFGKFSATQGNFFSPMGIGIDSLGCLYIADGLLNRIQVFAPS